MRTDSVQVQNDDSLARRAYVSPQLTLLGSVSELTESGTKQGQEDFDTCSTGNFLFC